MVQQLTPETKPEIIYPDSDGEPMSDNTKQFRWIVTIKENLEILFANNPEVFVAGDLLWYPVEGNNKIRQAPDTMVAFGRPKGDRGSYRQWEENNIPPKSSLKFYPLATVLEKWDKNSCFISAMEFKNITFTIQTTSN